MSHGVYAAAAEMESSRSARSAHAGLAHVLQFAVDSRRGLRSRDFLAPRGVRFLPDSAQLANAPENAP